MIASAKLVTALILSAVEMTRPLSAHPVRAPQFSAPFHELIRQAEQDLTSGDPSKVAWGAYHAGTYHLTSTIPLLQGVLESPPQTDGRVRRALVDVVLDALIQLNAAVPAPLVDRFLGERPVQALALMANATGRESVLLARLQTASGISWYAIANILLQDKSQALAVHLLRTVHLRLRIYVADDANRGGTGSGGLSIGVADGIGQNAPEFPPHAEYRFQTAARPGVIVLATGPTPIYYSRTVTADWQYPVSSPMMSGPLDRDRLQYLLAMLGPGEGVRVLEEETSVGHRWTTRKRCFDVWKNCAPRSGASTHTLSANSFVSAVCRPTQRQH